MKENVDINKELKEIAPFLSKLDKSKEGYDVPFNYFETLPDELMAQMQPATRTKQSATSENKPSLLDWLASLLQPRYAMALATVVCTLLIGSYFFSSATNDLSNSELLAANISAADVQMYVQDNIDEFAFELLTEEETVEVDYNTMIDLNASELQQYIEEEVLEELEENDFL